MAHLQYLPGDPRLVDQLVYELKSKGIFDQFRKDCIADVDTRPAYQNLRQRVENSVSAFLSRQCWQPDLNKNQLREKLRKHILDGNYLEQGLERIVDQVVNPRVASVFIPQVEDLVYNYLGITRKKSTVAESSNGKVDDLLPNDLEAVSPGSVKSNDDKNENMEIDDDHSTKMDIDEEKSKEESVVEKVDDTRLSGISELTIHDSNNSVDKGNIPFPPDDIIVENIPPPENSPPKKVEWEKIELPKESSVDIPLPDEISADIPLPDEITEKDKEHFFKPINSEEDEDSSSDSSLRRNMSPLTPIRNFNNENSCDAQQAFENDLSNNKNDEIKEPSTFRFTIEAKSAETSSDAIKIDKKDSDSKLAYQFNNQVNMNNFNTPVYEDSSNSNNLQIDYESDATSRANKEFNTNILTETKTAEPDQKSEDSKKGEKQEEKKSSQKSSHRSRDSHRHSSSKDRRSDSKQSSSKERSRHDKSKSSKDESKSKSSDKERSKDKSERKESKDSKESSRHKSSHKSSHRESKSHRSSSSSHRHSSKHSDDKKSTSSSQKEKDKSYDKNSKDRSKDSKSSSHQSDKSRKSSSSSSTKSKHEDKEKDKKNKKETDDHYSLSGRGNPNRRSTDRDSNDGSSSSKGSHNPPSSKSSESKKDSKTNSKLDSTTTSGDSTSPSDKENIVYEMGTKAKDLLKAKPVVRIERNLETPVASPPRLPFVPDVTIKKPKFAANLKEAKQMIKMRKFLEEEQRRMNQEAALLLEFQANVRPSLSQVYSSVSGPELEFACISNPMQQQEFLATSIQSNNHQIDIEESNCVNKSLESDFKDITNDISVDNKDIAAKHIMDLENISNKCENDNTTKPHYIHEDEIKKEETPVQITTDDNTDIVKDSDSINEDKKRTAFFEVTIITEELSESEEINEDSKADIEEIKLKDCEHIKKNSNLAENVENHENKLNDNCELNYFAEHEKYSAELERARFSNRFKELSEKYSSSNKIYLINCDTYVENVFREVSKDFGEYDIINYHRNGHLKLPKATNVVKNINLSAEVTLPIDGNITATGIGNTIFSPPKSDCSFDLSNDYDAKLEEMVTKASRKEIMEIILGNIVDEPDEMPKIDYCTESSIDNECYSMKRKISEVETTVNNNTQVLSPNKIRILSNDHISSTTAESEEILTQRVINNTRSKYLGKPGRVGLPRPRRSNIINSPSSDKSVENYEENTPSPQTVNGRIKATRTKVQRYDTTDLYKPKLHYLSRRNNIT